MGKKVLKRKKRGLRPEKSGGDPAYAGFAAGYHLDIHGKTVF